MRNLKLATPRMTGTDVLDWQAFLNSRGAAVDADGSGVFAMATSQATKAFQSATSLDADGVVGPATFAAAIRAGFQSSTRTIELGMDASVNCKAQASCIVTTGMKFVVRYYSKFSKKAMGVDEAGALSAAGLKLVVVYQDSQDNIAAFDAAQGKASALRALDQAKAVGQPGASGIYFAADFDPIADDIQGPIAQYFMAVNQVFRAGAVQYGVGIYGSGLTCRLMRDAGLADFAWLSQSTGFREYAKFRPRAHMIQIAPSRNICGGKLNIDDDIAQVSNYGAFRLS